MSIRKRKTKKAINGITYQVTISYVEIHTQTKKTHTKSGFNTYEDALMYEQLKKEELSYQNQYLKKYKITIDQLFNDWMSMEAKYKYQDNTIIDYKNRYNKHIKNKLGNYLVCDINYLILQEYFNNNYDIGLSTNYKIKKILNGLINFGIKCGYCNMNPIPLIHVVGIDNSRYNNQIINDHEFDIIIQELLDKKTHINYVYALALYIGRYTGLRISEAFALTIHDFNFEKQTINISKKVVYANLKKDEIYIKNQMKTKSSKSIIPFHKDLQIIIKKWKNYHNKEYILSDSKGKFINPKQLEYALWSISKKYNINIHYHLLRHTLATKLINNGADLKCAQEILRHANISTTMNIYTHVNENKKLKALYKAFPVSK